jgi:hypothetical protein
MSTRWIRSRPARVRLVLLAASVAALAVAITAVASHPEASLPGSNFEIDVNANLKVDDSAPSIDWASVNEARNDDAPSGRGDDSYAGGSKEDDPCPGTTTGSIPNNKSDLLSFGAYVEPETGGPGFLNLFWTRINEPSGTTLMDFELNQSTDDCGNGVNPERTEGDLLIEYRIEQGGASAQIKVREWTGSAWGAATDLTGTAAAGTINSTAIPAGESDGLISSGSLSPRTFGEAQLDLDFILPEGDCVGFGSAFLKSRASDSFTSQMKDFIGPEPVSINNCGSILISKTRKHAADGAGDHPHEGVDFTIDGGDLTEPIGVTTDEDGEACVGGLALSSTAGDYTVTETEPAGYAADDASQTVSVTGQASCGSGNEDPVTFSNTPLTDITVTVDSQVDGGTASTIDCNPDDDPEVDAETDEVGDGEHTLSDKEPGTYTCVVFVDP